MAAGFNENSRVLLATFGVTVKAEVVNAFAIDNNDRPAIIEKYNIDRIPIGEVRARHVDGGDRWTIMIVIFKWKS